MTSQLHIVEKMCTLFDETIHIMPKCTMHLHGHQNKVMPLMKPSILVDLNNGTKFHGCTYWSTNDQASLSLEIAQMYDSDVFSGTCCP
jgi:hypothetical protein